jgi:hypothetical protein
MDTLGSESEEKTVCLYVAKSPKGGPCSYCEENNYNTGKSIAYTMTGGPWGYQANRKCTPCCGDGKFSSSGNAGCSHNDYQSTCAISFQK